ncbi:hypothetical protein Ahy_B03g066434 [Arachis hypogaea]|uniref:Uncharacterized protein n=1 Tax=Arachis hypogaea TaxID=3818 RepID=A0A445A427_ARAHY|nr:hypothetical protein Ahy_B03g066434 [Arachis hypogaea]
MVEMESLKAKRKCTSSLSHEDANLESVNELQSPPRIRTRGHPKNRLGSKLDKQIANATKNKKTKALNERIITTNDVNDKQTLSNSLVSPSA